MPPMPLPTSVPLGITTARQVRPGPSGAQTPPPYLVATSTILAALGQPITDPSPCLPQVLLKRIEAGSFDDPAPGGPAGAQGQSPGTPVPGGAGGMNGPLPPPPHSVGLPPGGPQNLGGQQPWGGGGGGGGGGGVSPRGGGRQHGGMSVGPMSAGARDGGGAGGASQGSSKRARTSGGAGNGSGGDGGSSPAGSAVGNGTSGGGAGTRSSGGRSGTPSQMDEAPPTMPPVLSGGMSHMVVTRPGAGGGEGGGAPGRGLDRGPSLGFGSLPAFSEGAGASGAAGAPASAVRLAQERSLPVGVTDPAEVRER